MGRNKNDNYGQNQNPSRGGNSQSQGANRYDAFMGSESGYQQPQSNTQNRGRQGQQASPSSQQQRVPQNQRPQNRPQGQYPAQNHRATQQYPAQQQRSPQQRSPQQRPANQQYADQQGTQMIPRQQRSRAVAQQQGVQQTQLIPQAENQYDQQIFEEEESFARQGRSGRNGKKESKKNKKNTGVKKNGKPKMSSSKKIALGVIIALVAVLVIGGGFALAFIVKINKSLSFDKKEMQELKAALSDVAKAEDPFWMLLMGTDDDEGTTRADTIILAYVDPGNLEAALISIPRDTRVYIPGYGYQKINAAHAYGGPSLAVETVSQFAGVPISHYAELNFASFYDMVDALGGVEVDVPVYVTATDSEGVPLWAANGEVLRDLEPGLQTLDANGALVFCRSRYYSNGDYQRQANQRIFLKALANKVLNSDLKTIVSAATTIANAVSTDMSVDEIVQLAQMLRGMNMEDIYTYTVPSYADMIDEISYVIADEAAFKSLIQSILDGEYPEAQDSSIAGITGDTYANANSTEDTSEY